MPLATAISALITSFTLGGGAIWWAGATSAEVTQLKQESITARETRERLIGVEKQVQQLDQKVEKLDSKSDEILRLLQQRRP